MSFASLGLAEPLLRAVASLVGEADRLAAARMYFAWAHGFITMELAGAFRLGGNVDAAFEFGLGRLVAAFSRPVRSQKSTPEPLPSAAPGDQ